MMNRENIFDYIEKHPEYKVVLYGAGAKGREKRKYFDRIDYYCDRNATQINEVDGIKCITIEELDAIQVEKIVLVCIKDIRSREAVVQRLRECKTVAQIFDLFDNEAFIAFNSHKYNYEYKKKSSLNINIVCRDNGWIFTKFAEKLKEYAIKEGHTCNITGYDDPNADVNHYIGYHVLTEISKSNNTAMTTMITHVDTEQKLDLIKFQAENDVMGICMSEDMVNKLSKSGVPRSKICYINPAHDHEIKPRKIVIGMTYKCHGNVDFRKRDDAIVEICKSLNPYYFKIVIMGEGWKAIIKELETMGFEVEYYDMFDREKYMQLMPCLDYWLYYGFDEGAMGYLDALAAGVKTIVTPQGYHLDNAGGPTYKCSTIREFSETLLGIQEEKKAIIDSVKEWTWENYAKKHIEVWKYLTRSAPLSELFAHQCEYKDGIFSVVVCDNTVNNK